MKRRQTARINQVFLYLTSRNFRRFSGGLILVISIFLNILILPYIDDFRYALIYPTDVRVSSLQDILLSMKNHWFGHGGRIPAHMLASVFMQMDCGLLFDLCNSAVFLLAVYLIGRIASRKNHPDGMLLLSIAACYWLFNPSFAQTVLWLTGACNYLWMPAAGLAALCWALFAKDRQWSWKSPFLLLLFLIAGWGNENSSLVFLLLIILELIHKKSTSAEWTYAVVMAFGYILMIIAPGNFARADQASSPLSLLFSQIPSRMMSAASMLFRCYWELLLVYAVLLVILLFQKGDRSVFRESLKYLAAALVCNFLMIASPYYPERASIGVLIFLLIAAFILVTAIREYLPKTSCVVFFAVLLVFGLSFAYHGWIMIGQYRYETDIDQQIRNQVAAGNRNPVVQSDIHTESSEYCLNYNLDYTLSSDPDYWVNQAAAAYYGADTISVIHSQNQ